MNLHVFPPLQKGYPCKKGYPWKRDIPAKGLGLEKVIMVLMKAARKRAAGAGNCAPKKRQGFPDVSQDDLEEAIDQHIRVIGVREGMNLLEYINLLPQQAENARAIFKLHPLIKELLGVSPSAEIKYKNLKQAFTLAMQKFGHGLLSKHWDAGRKSSRLSACAPEALEEGDQQPHLLGKVWVQAGQFPVPSPYKPLQANQVQR